MLFDMHVHSAEGSPCAKITNRELVRAYKEKSYDGFVLTNHVSRGYMVNSYKLSYNDYCKYIYDVYLQAKQYGDEEGIKVMFGQEFSLDATISNDYLVYGLSYEQMIDYGDMMTWTPAKLKEVANKDGFLFYQAHPFRNGMFVKQPGIVDGIEVYNGHGNHDSRNDIANMWADKFGFRKLSGSDFHGVLTMEPGGVYFEDEINDSKDVAKALLANRYTLK